MEKKEQEGVRIKKVHKINKMPGRHWLFVKSKILCVITSMLSIVFGDQEYRRKRNFINCFERMIWSASAHTNLKMAGYTFTDDAETPCALFVRCMSERLKRAKK